MLTLLLAISVLVTVSTGLIMSTVSTVSTVGVSVLVRLSILLAITVRSSIDVVAALVTGIRFTIGTVTTVATLSIVRGSNSRSGAVAILGLLVSNTGQLATLSYSSASHDNTLAILAQLSDLVTLDILASSSIAVIMLIVVFVSFTDIGTIIGIRGPIAITISISVIRNPSMDTLSIGMILLVEVRGLFVLSVKSNLRSLVESLSLSVILDNFPVLLDRDINIAELDLSLLLLLNLGELLPLD